MFSVFSARLVHHGFDQSALRERRWRRRRVWSSLPPKDTGIDILAFSFRFSGMGGAQGIIRVEFRHVWGARRSVRTRPHDFWWRGCALSVNWRCGCGGAWCGGVYDFLLALGLISLYWFPLAAGTFLGGVAFSFSLLLEDSLGLLL